MESGGLLDELRIDADFAVHLAEFLAQLHAQSHLVFEMSLHGVRVVENRVVVKGDHAVFLVDAGVDGAFFDHFEHVSFGFRGAAVQPDAIGHVRQRQSQKGLGQSLNVFRVQRGHALLDEAHITIARVHIGVFGHDRLHVRGVVRLVLCCQVLIRLAVGERKLARLIMLVHI